MTEECAPVGFQWDGEVMRPASRFRAQCDRQFVVGEHYTLEQRLERSMASHRAYFAELTDAWHNLPERWAERLPTMDHLRAYALIRTGYANSASFSASSAKQARDLALFMKPRDLFSVVTVEAATVTVWTAQSQSMRAMGKAKFQKSKDKVLDYVATMIGASRGALAQNTRDAA